MHRQWLLSHQKLHCYFRDDSEYSISAHGDRLFKIVYATPVIDDELFQIGVLGD